MTRRWIVTALGQDRPGIVSSVTEVLYRLGCNLEDSAMTRLEGEFAIMLIFSTPPRLTPETLCGNFASLERRLGLTIHLKPLTVQEAGRPKARVARYLISVYGADRPGIVFKICQLLAKQGTNVTDLHTHRSRGSKPSLYMMLLDVEIPPRVAPSSLQRRLKQLAKSLKVQVSMRAAEADVL